ncbi:hypothetical protein J6590_097447 [Homalodisca vitripennis]|nr:hypothetical protein J6590_084569 [Homalodisca vitripennis]KAG8299581.1 hypothetical protein J6590_097447 [Homalodisca vitripennis]
MTSLTVGEDLTLGHAGAQLQQHIVSDTCGCSCIANHHSCVFINVVYMWGML